MFLEEYDYSVRSENDVGSAVKKESVALSNMPQLESDEEVNKEKGLKILIPKKLLTKLPILSAQIKAENNLNKLKNELDK